MGKRATKQRLKRKTVVKAAPRTKPRRKASRRRKMTSKDKDKPELGAVGENPAEKKNTPPPYKQPNTPNTIHNRDQDPDHPANKTLSRSGDPSPRPVAEGVTVPPEELLTEQEKEAADNPDDPRAGVGPYDDARSTTGPAKTIEDEGIGPRTPYPTGNPPPPSVSASLSQGIWQGDEDVMTPNDARDAAIRDAFHDGTTKDSYHTGDTVVDGPDPDGARRKRDEENRNKARDQRPQQRVGGPQEKTTPPRSSGL